MREGGLDRYPPGRRPRYETPAGYDVGRDRTPAGESQERMTAAWDPDTWKLQMQETHPLRKLQKISEEQTKISRRSFLKGMAAVGAASAVGIDYAGRFSPLAKWLDDQIEGQYNYDEIVKQAKEFMRERYGVELIMGTEKEQSEVLGDRVLLEKYQHSLKILVQEISKYPPEMIQKVGEGDGLRIRIAEKIRVKETDINKKIFFTRVAGLANPLRDGRPAEFLLNSAQTEESERMTIHHEFNHLFVPKWQGWREQGKIWHDLHAPFKNPYSRLNPANPEHTRRPRYFLTDYASSNAGEDMATCIEWMMTPIHMAEFVTRWRDEKDPAIKNILGKKYLETARCYKDWSGGKIDNAFWQSIIDLGFKELAEKEKKSHDYATDASFSDYGSLENGSDYGSSYDVKK